MGDSCIDFIASSLSSLTGVRSPILEECQRELDSFLRKTEIRSIRAVVGADGVVKVLRESDEKPNNSDIEILFVKRSTDAITEENISRMLEIHTIQGCVLDSLYNTLRNVYFPTLLNQSQSEMNTIPPRVQQLLADLDATLNSSVRSSLRQLENQNPNKNKVALDNISTITEPIDELKFWNNVKADKFKAFARTIEQLIKEMVCPGYDDLESLSLPAVSDLVGRTGIILNRIWETNNNNNNNESVSIEYPQERMVHLMNMIGNSICKYVQGQLSSVDIWKGVSGDVRLKLQYFIRICDEWISTTERLTTIQWVKSEHRWNGSRYENEYCQSYRNRLEDVLRIRQSFDEMSQLLSEDDRDSLRINDLFDALQVAQPLLYNPYADRVWRDAKEAFERSISSIVRDVTAKIRNNVRSVLDKPLMLLKEFQRFENLLKYPRIRQELLPERESMLMQLGEHVKKLESSMDKRDTNTKETLCEDITTLRQISSKVAVLLSSCESILGDVSGFERFCERCKTLLSSIKSLEQSQFSKWCKFWQKKLQSNVVIPTGPVVRLKRVSNKDDENASNNTVNDFEDSYFVVNLSDFITQFLGECAQVVELGFELPSSKDVSSDISKKFTESEKIFRCGLSLKKISNYYNSLLGQRVPSQRRMLESTLKQFYDKVSSCPHWENLNECEKYCHKIQSAVSHVSNEIRTLRKHHEYICSLTVQLMNMELLKQPDAWRSKWRIISDFVSGIKSKYKKEEISEWLVHWDHQIYKTLEASYQIGLETLNETMSGISVELVFTNKKLDFKPSIHEIRKDYYGDMKKFVSMPSQFEGLGGNSDMFKSMSRANSESLRRVYRKAENILEKLNALLIRYSPWVRLAQVDLDQYVETYVIEAADYIANFNAMQTKRFEISKLPDFEKFDCVTVSLTSFKLFLEDFVKQVTETMLILLRRNILQDFKDVDMFLENAIEKLNYRPMTLDDIAVAQTNRLEIENKAPTIRNISNHCVEMKLLLNQYAPNTSVDISEVSLRMANLDGEGGRWAEFDHSLRAFNNMIQEQMQIIRQTLGEEVQQLNEKINKFADYWKKQKPGEIKSWDAANIHAMLNNLDEIQKNFNEVLQARDSLVSSHQILSMQIPDFPSLRRLETEIDKTMQSWSLLKQYFHESKALSDQDWLTFSTNVFVLQDFAMKWIENVKNSKDCSEAIGSYINGTVERIKKCVPALKYCRGEAFEKDHWSELLHVKLQLSREVNKENVKVEHLLSRLDILNEPTTLTFVKNLQARALGEVQIREAFSELQAWEREAEVKILTTQESGRRLPLIKDWKDNFIEISDKQSLLGSLKESQFYKAFVDKGKSLETRIDTLDFVLHTLNSIQRKWVYLEPIFGRGSLPTEEARFRRVHEEFAKIMEALALEPKLFNLIDEQLYSSTDIRGQLSTMLHQLERCQKSLADFLEAKRSAMPRFYFIGDDDLLEILGQAKNPTVIQSHLKKLFQGIHKVKFNENNTKIVSMISSCNEVVDLKTPVEVSEHVDKWLDALVTEMRRTLATLLVECYNAKTINWNFPAQIISLSYHVKFTEDMEDAFRERNAQEAIGKVKEKYTALLHKLTNTDFSSEPLTQIKMKNLVFDLVHQIDVADQLIAHGTVSVSDWQWSKQLRYYLADKSEGKVMIRMHDASFEYTYEYQGNAPRLVHTPLTDKCYLTLTQGMRMGFGGNPYGPAGTGKTESVKALALCMGRQVLVFNCDEALESTSMIRIFIGIVKCGAWGCFDEFNRLKEDQLSAISQQIQMIQDAIKEKKSPISLLGKSVNVDFNSGIFVTLNPAGKGYGGRSRLPDNLKALFRPVAMGAPDNELIAEVSLVTEGFTKAKDLASKIVSLFKLSRQLLSPQQHYDWGLRALKAVLNTGGRLIQSYKNQGKEVLSDTEYEILIKAVRVNTLSKLTYNDTYKFLALIGDIFPGVKSADISGGELETAIYEVMKEKPFHLVEDAGQVKKMIQLKESLDQRMGCVIVGPSGCGKSSLWRVLAAALKKCGQAVFTYVMNPKSMPRERLLGHMDLDTREWNDGVLTDAARKVVKEPSEVSCWIVCDGDVDPEWIESLNSVLDDNHLLTLPNGERISFGSNVNFLFETHDLRFASPATISRMGMIFLSDEDVDVKRIVQRWLTSLLQGDRQKFMSDWIEELFYKALNYVLNIDSTVETTMVGTVINGLSQIREATSRQEFICGLIRGLGGNLSLSQRSSFAKEVFQWSNERPPDMGSPLDCTASGGSYMAFPPIARDRDSINLHEIGDTAVVPTISVQRTLSTLENWINNMEPFILVGPEGCGKSMIINHAFSRRKNTSIATLNCNAQTTADDIISKIAQTCGLFSSPEGRVYRPRDSERLVLYLKDINLPKPDMYDTCQLIAFLQQLITFEGFYDDKLEFLRLERIQIVASINAATTVGRHPLSTRFTAVVRICVVDYPDTAELVSVYSSFLQVILNSVTMSQARLSSEVECQRLATAIVDIYQKTKEKFTVDDRRHYLFTPRDVTLWVRNLSRYDLSSVSLYDVVAHEACRIFRDRLVGSEHLSKFDQQLSMTLNNLGKFSMSSITNKYFSSLVTATGVKESEQKSSESKEGEVSESMASMGGKMVSYTEDSFKSLVTQGIMYYEREKRDLNMLLFPEILEHIAHIDRVLSSYKGHLLLAGRSGVGRRNAVTVAAFMLGYEFHTPSISRDNQVKQFKADVKTVLQIAGIKGEPIVFLIEDFQIVSDTVLEITNSLLSSGEVPGLYTHEDLEPLLAPLQEIMREQDSKCKTKYEFFVSRIRKNLHIALCMDPGHPQFLYRCESNPALYSQCTVLWIGEWQTKTLKAIPYLIDGIKEMITKSSDNENLESSQSESKHNEDGKFDADEEKSSGNNNGNNNSRMESKSSGESADANSFIETVLAIHNSCASLNAAPRDYLVFLQTWHSLYVVKKEEVSKELKHLLAGLTKLEDAANVVNDLRTNAAQQEKDLRIAQAAADRAMDEISKALSSATERKQEVGEVRRTVTENEEITQQRKKRIESELADIQPTLDAAQAAVGSIRQEHLNEIKALTAPPEAIADVLQAVLMMLGVQDLSWLSMKKFLSNRGVKEEIINFDAKRLTADVRKNVAKLIKKKSTSFEEANIQRVSVAAAPMAEWVKANIRYSLVIEKIEPLQQELEDESKKLVESQERLKRCEEELKEIDERVHRLKNEFAGRTAEAERLKRNLHIAATTLDKAEGLINQLSGEQTRWKTQAKQLRSDLQKLPMKMLLASGFATYLAKTPEDIRESMIKKWQDITGVNGVFSFKRVMSTESELLQWKSMSLPTDDLSQENGLVITNNNMRVPFIIDPASASTEWLKTILSSDKTRPLEVVSHHDTRFQNQVELAVRFGKTLLILEVDGIEPMLYPLCRKDLCHQGARSVITIGEKTVDYNENFRLILVTRNPNPDIPPDAASMVTQINFTVTRSGLEGQLLGIAIQHEQPELEKAKGELLKREEDFKVQLAGLEKDLLQALATAEGDLLENTSLIESLSRTKEKAAEIEDSLIQSAEASIKLDQQREVYRKFAHTGSKLFFLVKSLQAVNNMYQFSLSSFLSLFKDSLKAGQDSDSIEQRLNRLCSDLEVRVLYFVGRALFKSDRLMFALHLVKGMHSECFEPKEWEVFSGSFVASVSEGVPRGYPNWAAQERQDAFRILNEHLPQLVQSLELDNIKKWQRFSKSQEAENDLPGIKGLSPFQKVLIVQTFRPDRLHSAMLQFCTNMLNIESISPPPLSLAALFAESDPNTPVLLISSPGADPSKELEEFACKTIGQGQFEEMAMGGGLQEEAIFKLRQAAQSGSWLCLKNLHLVVAWLPTLEKELSSLKPHADFRLWITSESHTHFPSILLQQSLKATYESPPGIKKNLQRTIGSWDPEEFNRTNDVEARMMFLLACFHSVLQERRNYIPQGWTKFYEFSYGDLKAGTYVVQAATEGKNDASKVDWKAVHGLMEDAIYGGRIDNLYDLRVLRAYLKLFFSEELSSSRSREREVIQGTPLLMPETPDYESLNQKISMLQDVDPPFMFLLPDNIERSIQRTNSSAVIKLLRALSTLDVEGSKYDRDKWRAQLGPILEVWQQLASPSSGILNKKGKEAKTNNNTNNNSINNNSNNRDNNNGNGKNHADPVDDFVSMENELASDLCHMVDVSMQSLRKVLFGSGLLTPSTQSVAIALLSGKVPSEWTRRWDRGPEKPQSWLRELVRKRLSLMRWQSLINKGNLLHEPLSLGDLFNPATFVNALRQQTARKLSRAIDEVKLICSWDRDGHNNNNHNHSYNDVKKTCPLPCTLCGLLLQGASYSECLNELSSDANEIQNAPNVTIGFVPIDVGFHGDDNAVVSIPIYLNPSREDFLIELDMNIKQSEDQHKWILSGVALFLNEED